MKRKFVFFIRPVWTLVIGLVCWSSVASAQVHTFSTPSDDRWHYPFNFSAGARPTGSCFGAVGSHDFNNRDGQDYFAWNTQTTIPAGAGAANYHVHSVKVTLSNQANAGWPVDLSADEWFTTDLNGDGQINGDGIARGMPGDTDGESSDLDNGRPAELYGLGFGPTYTSSSWNENSAYVGSIVAAPNSPRDPFPFAFQDGTQDVLHVEDHAYGLWNTGLAQPVSQFTPRPWAIGNPINYTPGSQATPFDVEFEINLCESQNRVRKYFENQLNQGKVFVGVNSLRETVQGGPANALYSFVMKEGLAANPGSQAPKLEIELGSALFDCNVNGMPDECEFGTLAAQLKNSGDPSTQFIVTTAADQSQQIEVQSIPSLTIPVPVQLRNISSYFQVMKKEILREVHRAGFSASRASLKSFGKFLKSTRTLAKNYWADSRLNTSALPAIDPPTNTAGSLQAMVTVLAKEITEGAGGPPVPVMIDYQINGGNFQPLFDGLPVSPGQNQIIDLNNGTLQFRAEGTVTALSDSLHAIILRNGDSFDTVYELRNVQPPFDNQSEITCYVAQFLDLNSHQVILPEGAMLILFEVGTDALTSIYADFQDLILFVNPL